MRNDENVPFPIVKTDATLKYKIYKWSLCITRASPQVMENMIGKYPSWRPVHIDIICSSKYQMKSYIIPWSVIYSGTSFRAGWLESDHQWTSTPPNVY